MQLKRSQFLALAAGALMTPLLASCGAKGGAPSSPVSIDPPGEIKPREISWLLSRAAGGAVIPRVMPVGIDEALHARGHAGAQRDRKSVV